MKKVSLALAVLALVSCKYDQNGNKNILPKDDTRNLQTVNPQQVETASAEEESIENETTSLDAAGNYIYDVGEIIEISLPDGTNLEIGSNSTENQLFEMLNNADFNVSENKTDGWVTLDRVYFNTGSDQLTDASNTQLSNIEKILKAFPTTEVKFGGYTDNTGSQEINQPLSEGRAKSVMNTIINAGIDSNRMSAEGYGSEHPVCVENDSEVCKAQNRRVDIRITKK